MRRTVYLGCLKRYFPTLVDLLLLTCMFLQNDSCRGKINEEAKYMFCVPIVLQTQLFVQSKAYITNTDNK